MIFLIVFLLLCLVEAVIIYFKWDEVSNYVSIGKTISKIAGYEKQYASFIDKVVAFFVKRKEYLWFPILLITLINLIAAILTSLLVTVAEFIFAFFK